MKTIIIIAGLLVGTSAMAGGMSGDKFETKRTTAPKQDEIAKEDKVESKDEPTVEKRRPFHHTGALENAR